MAKKLASMRKSYELAALIRQDMEEDPFVQFSNWLSQAVDHEEVAEANAMVFSTVSHDLQPSSRVVLLKGLSQAGLVFYTNYESRKGQELSSNEKAAANFWWPPLQRQIRVEGLVKKVAEELSDEYFESRPVGSRRGAIASPQSEVIQGRTILEANLARLNSLDSTSLQRPNHWGGYILSPSYFEFWQGRANRLHDRFAYQRNGQHWIINRLAP